MLAIEPALFADVHGPTDTEVVFHLALTFGLEQDPIGALAHVALPDAERRLGRDRDPEPAGDRLSLVVDRLDQPADALGHALLVEQEASVGSLEQPGVQQRHRGMNHRVAVQRGLEDARGFLAGRPDVLDEPAQPAGRRARQTCEVEPGLELEEDVDGARFGDPHGVGQRAGLADDGARVVELEADRALERDPANGTSSCSHTVPGAAGAAGVARVGVKRPYIACGSPNQPKTEPSNVTISATLPSAIRRTSSASGL